MDMGDEDKRVNFYVVWDEKNQKYILKSAEEVGTEHNKRKAVPICSKCLSPLKIDWSYQEIHCPECGKIDD